VESPFLYCTVIIGPFFSGVFCAGFGVGVCVGVGVGFRVGVAVGLGVGFDVGVNVGVDVGVAVGSGVGSRVGVGVGVMSSVGVGAFVCSVKNVLSGTSPADAVASVPAKEYLWQWKDF